ncbi:MAG: DUF481 domain-containing protein [Cyclobacteriaceae bacterium]|nr:DUF481 domain-containing protein [Cyclobacteriaceae bacterium]
MRTIFLLIISYICYLTAEAQILNVDRNQIMTDTAKFVTGSIAFKFHLDNKNTTSEQKNSYIRLENENDLIFVGLKHNYIFISQFKYFNSSGGTFISAGYGHARANFLKMRTVSYELFMQVQYDRNRFMNNRFLIGGGPKFKISNTEKSSLFVGTHLMFEHERWDNPENQDMFIIKDLPKFSSYISARLKANDITTFRLVLYYQAGYDPTPGLLRNRVSYDAQMELNISSKLLFTLKSGGSYENHPIYPINKFIYSIENGILWKF